MNMNAQQIEQRYALAKEQYAALGVDADAALKTLETLPISLHCWQGDDVGGFEHPAAALSGGGIQTTGNYPGKARTAEELRADLDTALRLIPGTHRLNLHAIYGGPNFFSGENTQRIETRPDEHYRRSAL